MRVIEKNMNQAIRNGQDFRSSNTTVTHGINEAGQREVIIKLHGNHIATVLNDTMLLFDGGWQSNTTKSRLNALCYEFATGTKFFKRTGTGSWLTSTATLRTSPTDSSWQYHRTVKQTGPRGLI